MVIIGVVYIGKLGKGWSLLKLLEIRTGTLRKGSGVGCNGSMELDLNKGFGVKVARFVN